MESRKASCFLGKHKSGIHLMEDMLSTWGRRRRSTIMKKAMKKMIMAGALCIAGAALIAGCGDSGSSAGGGKQFLNIATGGTAGTYYPLGGALAELLNQNIKGMNASAQSTGASVANVNMLKDGSVDIAFIQNDIAYYAANGKEMFKDNKVKTSVVSLHSIRKLSSSSPPLTKASNPSLTLRAKRSLSVLPAPAQKPMLVRSSVHMV